MCEAIDMKMVLHSHFHKKGFLLSLILKARFFGSGMRLVSHAAKSSHMAKIRTQDQCTASASIVI